METTGKALIDFLDYAGEKALMKKNSALALKNASTQVLSVLDNWETLDVKIMNRDDVFRRFTNKHGQRFTPDSLMAYKRRFNQSITDFLQWVNNPEGWKPSSATRATTPKDKKPTTKPTDAPSPDVMDGVQFGAVKAGLIEYPYPLRDGRFAFLRLPVDLKTSDVTRIVAFLNGLAVEG